MINILDLKNATPEEHKLSLETKSIINTLGDTRNVAFVNGKVHFPQTEFVSIQSALSYVKEQEYLLLQKNRENNGEAIKEISDILDLIKKEFLSPVNPGEDGESYRKWQLPRHIDEVERIKTFLQNYDGDLSTFMNKVVKGRIDARDYEYFQKWNKELHNMSDGEAIAAFKKEVKELVEHPE
ncbi:MAG: hypothetical protein WCG98_04660 [bacterium]